MSSVASGHLTAGMNPNCLGAMHVKHRLAHTRGYLELGMLAEAAAELDAIPAEAQDSLEVLVLRVALLQEKHDWPALRLAAGEWTRRQPEEASAWVTWAYATRRAESLAAAERILVEAEPLHPNEPTIQFNLGCYACQRGDLRAARRRVDRAIAAEKHFEALAGTDPDLAPLRAAENADCPPRAGS
jgi:tetratricopeptide (TPR) repeat protein